MAGSWLEAGTRLRIVTSASKSCCSSGTPGTTPACATCVCVCVCVCVYIYIYIDIDIDIDIDIYIYLLVVLPWS